MTLYKLSKGGTSFEMINPMQESRVGSKSIAVNGHMWITGGYNGEYFDSTEFITTQNTTSKSVFKGSLNLTFLKGKDIVLKADFKHYLRSVYIKNYSPNLLKDFKI